MHYDLTELDQFYETPLGQAIATSIKHHVEDLWQTPLAKEQQGLLIGYPFPFLCSEKHHNFFWQTSPHLGARHWPSENASRTVLADDYALPFAEQFFDRILIAHTLETSSYPQEFLSEIHRVLTSRGRAIFIVPNRTGFWIKSEKTPFGMGRPYSVGQLKQSLKEIGFTSNQVRRAGFFPPWEIMTKIAPYCDQLGQGFCSALGGINIIEVSKNVYSVTPIKAPRKRSLIQPKTVPTTPFLR